MGEHFSLTLGSGQFIPGFEEQVAGHEAGEEFEVNVTFPEQYQAEELAGKAATFKVKLHEVKTKELPAADDEFAKDVSEYDTLDELKASIRKGMEEQNEKNAKGLVVVVNKWDLVKDKTVKVMKTFEDLYIFSCIYVSVVIIPNEACRL